uniref:Uncharacterized protein n=1 Tax=Chrysopogon zizanioides TaxID=167337 RepID=A0A7T3V4I3_9POAL|nr:hypothetical protein KQ334_mgp068 [Chrysopogon zizanioides]YP_010131851.1 hypothetical protein KQ334_mgp024 [Chrysopogon zizanioides]QPZ94327.1 hypothetical protein [Chrysopogon zizanioides]QPZ94371.1 hypothetical protein [Chrysopogon zizanioides]
MTQFKLNTYLNGSLSHAEEFILHCLKMSLARTVKAIKIKQSTEILKSMGMLPADFGFQYVMNIVNSKNESLRLVSGESSGSKTTPTSWSDLWEQFSKTKCPKAQPLVDLESPNALKETISNCFQFLQLPRTYCDIFAEGFGNRVRILIVFTEGVGCQFWWAMHPLNDDTGITTFHKIDNYKQFCQQGCLVDPDFTYSQFDHSEMLSSLKNIFIQNPLLAQELGIDESLETDHPWPESMLDMAKFAICLSNILMTETVKPQGVYNFEEK